MNLLLMILSLLPLWGANDDISLVFAGDAMQHDRQIQAARKGDTYDYTQYFQNIDGYIREADYAVVNMECSLGGMPYKGYPCFSAPDEFPQALKATGFDLFLHANNHCLDRRDKGLRRTLDVLDGLDVPHIGTYRNAAERSRVIPYMENIEGLDFAFLNYTYGTNGITVQGDVVVDYIDRKLISRDIAAARQKNADMIVVCIHWGDEYRLVQNKGQEGLAQFLIDEGVDMIIGAHPHVIQPMKIVHSDKYNKDVLLVYSLGNFVSAMRTNDTRGGAMVKVKVSKNNGKPKIKSAAYRLVFVQPPLKNENFEIIPVDNPKNLRDDSKAYFNKFTENARKIFNKYNVNVGEEVPEEPKPFKFMFWEVDSLELY